MDSVRLFLSVLLLCSVAYAVPANWDYKPIPASYYFDTQVTMTTDFTVSASPANVASGDPTDLRSGDEICSGATLTVTPSYSTKWATSSVSIRSIYPENGPAMVSAGAASLNRDIRWLPVSDYDDNYDWGHAWGFATDFSQTSTQDLYYSLTPFVDQPVTYVNTSGSYSGKEGGAGVYCKGQLEVLYGTTPVGTASQLPSAAPKTVTASGTGTRQISTRITNPECFAALVKHPLNTASSPGFFYLVYYTEAGPSLGAATATDTISLNVLPAGGSCSWHLSGIEYNASPGDDSLIRICGTAYADADDMQVTGVTSSNPGFSVAPFPPLFCSFWGIDPDWCPSDNGFNDPISTSGEICVLMERNPGASGGTTLSFTAGTIGSSCGGPGGCPSVTLTISDTDAFFCDIDPSSLTIAPMYVAEFEVDCRNIAGSSISCSGDNWYFADGVSGDFWEKDNTHALAYPTSAPGSTGTLNYESDYAHCWSDLTVVSSEDMPVDYQCEFIPSSADLETGDEQYFELNCFVDGSSDTPDDADYDLDGGLDGTLSDGSTGGVNFTAGANSSGDVRGFAQWSVSADDPILGIIATAEVEIGSGGGDDTNTTGGDDGDSDHDDTGSSDHCKIDSGPITVYPGYSGWAPIDCGPDRDIPCEVVFWDVEPPGSATITGYDPYGVSFVVNGLPGDTGRIWAEVIYSGADGTEVGDCFLPFTVETPECWEFS